MQTKVKFPMCKEEDLRELLWRRGGAAPRNSKAGLGVYWMIPAFKRGVPQVTAVVKASAKFSRAADPRFRANNSLPKPLSTASHDQLVDQILLVGSW